MTSTFERVNYSNWTICVDKMQVTKREVRRFELVQNQN